MIYLEIVFQKSLSDNHEISKILDDDDDNSGQTPDLFRGQVLYQYKLAFLLITI